MTFRGFRGTRRTVEDSPNGERFGEPFFDHIPSHSLVRKERRQWKNKRRKALFPEQKGPEIARNDSNKLSVSICALRVMPVGELGAIVRLDVINSIPLFHPVTHHWQTHNCVFLPCDTIRMAIESVRLENLVWKCYSNTLT